MKGLAVLAVLSIAAIVFGGDREPDRLQAAIDRVSATGGVVDVPSGVWGQTPREVMVLDGFGLISAT